MSSDDDEKFNQNISFDDGQNGKAAKQESTNTQESPVNGMSSKLAGFKNKM